MNELKSVLRLVAVILLLWLLVSRGCGSRIERWHEWRQENQEKRQERWDEWREDRQDRWGKWQQRWKDRRRVIG